MRDPLSTLFSSEITMTKIKLEDEEVSFLKVYLPILRISDKCPPKMIPIILEIRDNILRKLGN